MVARVPTQIRLPQPNADRPGWGRVGIVAVLGFAVGIAWPRLAGVRLGPNAPGESATSSEAPAAPGLSATNASGVMPPVVAPAPPAASASTAPLVATPAAPAQPVFSIGRGSVSSCKSESGEALKANQCGVLTGFDAIAHARIKKLAALPAAMGNEGKLSVVLTLDFPTNRVVFVDVGKSSTVKNPEAFKPALVAEFQAVSLTAVAHDHPRVTLSFAATLAPIPTGAATGPATATPADDGRATIVWDMAIVRDAPHTGSVVGRLPRGTKVQLGESKAGWYRVKFGAGLATEGWVYRAAIGR